MDIEVLTAREALFEIRRRIAKTGRLADLDEVAREGLDRTSMVNFELTDQLADRLAEAHAVLRKVDREGFPDDSELEGEVIEALTLPPDLEAIVERRIGPR